MNGNEALYALWIKTVTEKSPSAARLAAKTFASAEDVFKAKRSDFPDAFSEAQKALFEDKNLDEAEKILEKCEKLGMRVIPFSSSEMPEEVMRTQNPPCALFVKGTAVFSQNDVRVAIVGSRKATDLGKKTAARIAYELASAGITVVSGMAAGIDTAAHKGALYGGKETLAFLGGGADVVYPKENEELYRRIIGNGAVVSEYLPGSSAQGFHFPERNRLLSAFSKAVIIVESDENSGSMRTAEHAKKQGVPVLAIPGPIDSPVSAGTNRLIKEGCRAVTGADDVIEFLSAEYGMRLKIMKRLSSPVRTDNAEAKQSEKKTEKKEKAKTEKPERKSVNISSISDFAKEVFGLIEKRGSCAVDEICQELNADFGSAFNAVCELEEKDIVLEAEAGRYRIK
ncbi:MAG: DNA-processing protein DprA [Clostridia bacterium]|nr:DNA-processing protein DprA [Clostridia bacterium]